MHAIGICRGIVGIAQAKLAAPRHKAEFVDGSGIRARSAKRREIGDNGVGFDHHGFVSAKYLQGGVVSRAVDRIFQRIQSDQPMPRAQRDLAPSDINGIGQENVGAGEINSCHSGMRHRTRVYPSSAISLSKSATADLDAQARNPYSRWWLWIPGSLVSLAPRNDESHLRRDQIFHLHVVARFDDLGDPLPMAMLVIALVAENADRPGFLDQRR